MSETTHATLRAEHGQFGEMIQQSALSGETEHSDIYLNILENQVMALQQAPGESVLTYCSFTDEFFDDISLGVDIEEGTAEDSGGEEFSFEYGAEALLPVEQTLTYLDFASDGGTIELKFTGEEDDRLASYVRASGALEAWAKLPGSSSILDSVPHWLPHRFNSDDQYTNKQGDPAPVRVETRVSKLDTIVEAVKEDQDTDYYPIVIRDQDFLIDVGEASRSGVSGSLGANSIEMADESMEVENYYFDGFEEIFNVLSGPVSLQTAPGNNPLAVVQEGENGRVIRHVCGSVENAGA